MTDIEQTDYGAAWARMSFGGGIAVATLRGPLTRAVLAQFVGDWGPRKLQHRAESAVVCMDHALILFEMIDLYEVARRHMAMGQLLRPCALVVPPGLLATFRDHAWRAAQHGLLRDAFTESSRGLAWAQDRATSVRAAASGPQRASDS